MEKNLTVFEGGAHRQSALGRGLFVSMPGIALKRLSQRYEYGKVKYGNDDNFMKGIPVSGCYNSIMRHMIAYAEGDNTEDHLAAIAWNAFTMMYMEVHKSEFNDIPNRADIGPEECLEYLSYLEEEARL
jgi:hypothetical protein